MIINKIYRGHALRISVGITVLAIMLLSGTASAKTLTVNASGGADYTRIQDAINASSDGDTILVYSGTYLENVNVTKQLILKGIDTGGGKPVVDANRSGSAIFLSAGNSTLEGFTAVNSEYPNAGIYVMTSSNNIIRNNNASNNSNGIYLASSSNNTLSSNNASNNSEGIFLESSSNNTLTDNNASNNKGYGISLSGSNNTLSGNNAGSNKYSGISLLGSNNTLTDNNASNNNYGISLSGSNNTLSNNNASNNSYRGIYLASSSNNTLSGNNASNNFDGISLESSSNNRLSNNNASSNKGYGISLSFSSNSLLTNNIMDKNTYNFMLYGDSDSHFDNQIDKSNLVNEKSIYYIKNSVDTVYDYSTNAGTFYCINCVNVTIQDINLSANYAGIIFWKTNNSRIQNVNALNNNRGLSLSFSSNNILSGNNASNNNYSGISLYYSSNNTLSNNNALNNGGGISLDQSSNNTLSNNNASNNNYSGISLYYNSGNNTVSDNDASNNSIGISLNNPEFALYYPHNNMVSGNNASNNNYGIYIHTASNNTIYNNFFNSNINNFVTGYETLVPRPGFIYYSYPVNTWNITRTTNDMNIIGGPHLGGNVWAYPNGTGFSQTCIDDDTDGICDSPYVLDSNNTDYLPLAYKLPTAPTVTINLSGIPVVNQSTKDILSVDYLNFNASDPYNISITRTIDSSVVHTNNGTLKGVRNETIPINWTPQDTRQYLVEAKGSTIVSNQTISVYDSEPITPVPELSTIALTSAGLLGLIGLARLRRRN